MTPSGWWRDAVIYQIYPRSFADSDGDGIGDLPGITSRLSELVELGVDAIWLSPFFVSPQADAGYDVADYCDVDPLFGTLADAEKLLSKARELGLRVIIDLVPNHTSSEHAWFKEALAASPGSEERDRYIFRDGRGPEGEAPPNDWVSVFGGPAWTRVTEADGRAGQWYLHLFDVSQPDLNWDNPAVREGFSDILRFWLDRGVDGFRVDVAHGLVKRRGLPDWPQGFTRLHVTLPGAVGPPMWDQEGVHEIFRSWRRVLEEYGGDRVLVAEAWVGPPERLARYVRPDEMHQAFNFEYLETPWQADAIHQAIDHSLASMSSVGAAPTWVLSNHDVVRHASRLGLPDDEEPFRGIGPRDVQPDESLGLRRARAATLLMLALPGAAYIYQGEELGLPEHTTLPDEARQDPTWHRSGHQAVGRDGSRVPIPWEGDRPAFGFGPTSQSWLPQPPQWADYARDRQRGVPGSTYEMYRNALELRRDHDLGSGELKWVDLGRRDVLAFRNGDLLIVANLGKGAVMLPDLDVLLTSDGIDAEGRLPSDTTVWGRVNEVSAAREPS